MSAERLIAEFLIGDSAPMVRLRSLIARVAPTSLPVLIEGPTGSGKELVARALHVTSGRAGAFVPFNVCAIADTMFEDALFGHVRGAFTGALSDSPGYLAQADKGTAFFDEIGGLSTMAQAKLLRAIETREFRPVGGRRDVRSDFRVVAATNTSLVELEARGAFREDLRHRFGKLVLRVPPLAERSEDVVCLAQYFLELADSASPGFTVRGTARLERHDWPGNVRELRSVVESAAALAGRNRIDVDDLNTLLSSAERVSVREDFELRRTLQVLEEARGNVVAAAQLLGVNKATIYRRLRRAGVMRPANSGDRALSEPQANPALAP